MNAFVEFFISNNNWYIRFSNFIEMENINTNHNKPQNCKENKPKTWLKLGPYWSKI
jgi:hypothetical protein